MLVNRLLKPAKLLLRIHIALLANNMKNVADNLMPIRRKFLREMENIKIVT